MISSTNPDPNPHPTIKIVSPFPTQKFNDLKTRFIAHLFTMADDTQKRMTSFISFEACVNRIAVGVSDAMMKHPNPKFKRSYINTVKMNILTNQLQIQAKYVQVDNDYQAMAVEKVSDALKKQYRESYDACIIIMKAFLKEIQYLAKEIQEHKFVEKKEEFEYSANRFYEKMGHAQKIIEKYKSDLKNCDFLTNQQTKRLFRADIPRIKITETKY